MNTVEQALKERDDAILHWTKKYIECDNERIKFRRVLEAIQKHYEHPQHDNNWAHYTKQLVDKALGYER